MFYLLCALSQCIAENLGLFELSETTLKNGFQTGEQTNSNLFNKSFLWLLVISKPKAFILILLQEYPAVTGFSQHRMTLYRFQSLRLGKKSTINQFLICAHACLSTVGVWIANREGESSRTRAVAGKPFQGNQSMYLQWFHTLCVGQTNFWKGRLFSSYTLIKSNEIAVYDIGYMSI